VTIFGESSGAVNVTHLVSSPLAQHLFHRAIIQSGGPGGNVTSDEYDSVVMPDYTKARALRPFLKKHGHGDDGAITLQALESLTAEDVSAASLALGKGAMETSMGMNKVPDPFYVYIGDDVMPVHPCQAMKTIDSGPSVCRGKEILWGVNSFEASFLVNLMGGAIAGLAAYRMVLPSYIRGIEGYSVARETAEMPKNCTVEARNRLVARQQARIDAALGCSNATWTGSTDKDGTMMALQQCWFTGPICCEWLEAAAATNHVYQYTLNLNQEDCPAGNFHGLDLVLLCKPDQPEHETWVNGCFGRADGLRSPAAAKVGEAMVKSWTRFGKSGSPGEFMGLASPRYPQRMMLQSAPTVRLSNCSPDSDEVKLYSLK